MTFDGAGRFHDKFVNNRASVTVGESVSRSSVHEPLCTIGPQRETLSQSVSVFTARRSEPDPVNELADFGVLDRGHEGTVIAPFQHNQLRCAVAVDIRTDIEVLADISLNEKVLIDRFPGLAVLGPDRQITVFGVDRRQCNVAGTGAVDGLEDRQPTEISSKVRDGMRSRFAECTWFKNGFHRWAW